MEWIIVKMANKELIEKLKITKPQEVMTFERLPYKVHYKTDNPSDNFTNSKCPAINFLTRDLRLNMISEKPDYSLSVWIWKGVPKQFKEVVLYHELKEAESIYADKIDKHEAHKEAVKYHLMYAHKFLNKKDFAEFIDWQNNFKCYRIK